MLTSRRFKAMAVFTTLSVLLIAVAVVYAHHYDVQQGYIQLEASTGDPNPGSVYWNIAIGDVYFEGNTSHSGHSYAVENYSKYEISVLWEFAHKVLSVDEEGNVSLYEDASDFDTVILGKQGSRGKASDSYGRAELSVASIAPGMYKLDTYTSVDINYTKTRPGISKKIAYKNLPKLVDSTIIR